MREGWEDMEERRGRGERGGKERDGESDVVCVENFNCICAHQNLFPYMACPLATERGWLPSHRGVEWWHGFSQGLSQGLSTH